MIHAQLIGRVPALSRLGSIPHFLILAYFHIDSHTRESEDSAR